MVNQYPETAEGSEPIVLDAVQRQLVDLADDCDATVLAAGGTGATTVVIEVITDRIVKRGYPADSVMAIAASRLSAASLRNRIAKRLKVATPGPLAKTLPALAFQILRESGRYLGEDAVTLLTGAEQDRIVAELLAGEIDDDLDGYWPDHLDRQVRNLAGFRAELREFQARLLERGVNAEALGALAKRENRLDWAAVSKFVAHLEAIQDEVAPNAHDATELIAEALAAVTAGAEISSRLRLLLVDDAQELGIAGIGLVTALARSGVRVMLLGDPDLATSGFRGAVPGGFLNLVAAAGRTPRELVLPISHRQSPQMRSAVQRVTAGIGTATAGRQRGAGAGRVANVPGATAVVLASREAESAFIARILRERRIRENVNWQSMAVVVRSASTVTALVRKLRALEVPAVAAGVLESPRDDAGVRALCLALEVVLGRRAWDPEIVAELLLSPIGGLDSIGLRRLRAVIRLNELAGDSDRGAGELLVLGFAEEAIFAAVDAPYGRRAAAFAVSLRLASVAASAGATVEELLWGLWERSALASLWGQQAAGSGLVADEANRHLDAVVALFSAAARFTEREPDGRPGQFLDAWNASSVREDSLAPRGCSDAVIVGTPNTLLGLEFDTVVAAGLQAEVWPNLRIRGSLLGVSDLVDTLDGCPHDHSDRRRETLHDELRLLAATVAHASNRFVATAVDGEDLAPSAFLRLFDPEYPDAASGAPFTLRGMVARLRREMLKPDESQANRLATAEGLARLAAAAVPGAHPKDWGGLAQASTIEPLVDITVPDAVVPVSPSRIESFETCPLHWAIGRLGGDRPSTAASVGMLVHAAAQEIAVQDLPRLTQNWRLSLSDVVRELIDKRWGELEFETGWESERQRIRVDDIARRFAAYLREMYEAEAETVGTELRFTVQLGFARLNGMIDRVERHSDGSLLVVDIKTGEERNFGTDSKVADHAQLGAYQLAVAAGAVPNIVAGTAVRGAALVIVSRGSRTSEYLAPLQPGFGPEELVAFELRVTSAASGMSEARFSANIASHCQDPFQHGLCRLQIVKAVTA